MGLFGFLKKNKSTGQVPPPEQSDDLPPIPAPPGQQTPSPQPMQTQEDNPDLSQLDDMAPLDSQVQEPQAGAQNPLEDLTKAPPEPMPEPSPLPESWQIGGNEESQNSPESNDTLPEKPLVNIDDLAPAKEEESDNIPFSSPPPEEEPQPLVQPEPEPQPVLEEDDQLPEFTQEELRPVEDVKTQMFSGPEEPKPIAPPKQMPAYSYDTLPKEDDYVERKRRGPIEIYVSANDYAKLFREITRIDGLAKHSFKTVMKIRDISGNQNNLLKKYHADLDFINERLAYIDTVLFETD